VPGGGDANGACGLIVQFAQGQQFGVDFGESRPQGPHQALARLGGRDAAGGARQQSQPQPGLQPAHRMAQRRLGNPELRCRSGEAALLRYGEEGQKSIQVFACH